MLKPQLFLIHFAGGDIYSFNFLIPYIDEFSFETIELPGRGKRFNEDLLTEFNLAENDVFNQIRKKIRGHYIIYGHSLGAYLALSAASLLERIGAPPIGIIVSGNPGPGQNKKEEKKRYSLPKKDFIRELKLLGGITNEFFENKELFDFYEPILRADFELAENNSIRIESKTHFPIYAIMGSFEEGIENISNWKNYTSSFFNHEILEGDHFFIYKHPSRLSTIFSDCFKSWSVNP